MIKLNSRLLTEGFVGQNLARGPVPEGLGAGFDMRELRTKPERLDFAGQLLAKRLQMR